MLRVEVSRHIETKISTGAGATHAYPQYQITQGRYHTVSSKDYNTPLQPFLSPSEYFLNMFCVLLSY